jgi:transcription initiation factor IIE alpha subunit
MADVLSELRSSLEKRLRELEPLIKEHAQVREALDALKHVGDRAQETTTGARRSRTARTAPRAKGPGRPRGTGARAQEVLKLVHKHPGITVSELAKRMKIKPNYLYRVFSHLERDGQVTKRDKGYHPPEK